MCGMVKVFWGHSFVLYKVPHKNEPLLIDNLWILLVVLVSGKLLDVKLKDFQSALDFANVSSVSKWAMCIIFLCYLHLDIPVYLSRKFCLDDVKWYVQWTFESYRAFVETADFTSAFLCPCTQTVWLSPVYYECWSFPTYFQNSPFSLFSLVV